jgi:hypothetical protein
MQSITEPSSTTETAGLVAGSLSDDAVLCKLQKIWQSHHRRGLDDRHRTGVIINQQFGAPTERQSYRAAKLKNFSKGLGIPTSELSRMRWFAHHFKSVADLKAAHPEVTNWTQVKDLLVTLRHRDDVKPESPASDKKLPDERPSRRVTRAIENARKSLSGLQLKSCDDGWDEVNGAVKSFLDDVGKYLGIVYRLEPLPAVAAKAASKDVAAREIVPATFAAMQQIPA